MATLFWTALNPNIRLVDTTKLMHSRFLYRLAISASGAGILRDPEADIDIEVIKRNATAKNYNFGGSWRSPRPVSMDAVPLLYKIKDVKEKFGDSIKIRIEDPSIQFYAEDEDTLKKVADALRYQDNEHFESFMRPANQQSTDLLKSGYILRKNKPEYQYRIMIREGRYSDETKQSFLSWINQMGEEIHVPPSLRNCLENEKGKYIWNSYILTNDSRVSVLISMINAHLVAKVEEFSVV